MATLTAEQVALIRLQIADPSGPDEALHDAQVQALYDEAESINGTVAKAWRVKAATVADWYLANIDGSFLSRNQVFEHCIAMAEHYEEIAGTSGVMSNIGLEGPNAVSATASSEF